MATPTKTTTSKTSQTTQADALAAYKNYQQLANQFRPGDTAAFMRSVGGLYPDYSGNILSDVQLRQNAQQNVMGILGPQMQQIGDMYARRGAAGSKSIGQLTNAYTGRMVGWGKDVAGRNQANLQQMAGLNAGLANFTRDRNAQLQGDLTGALTGMGAPQGTLAATNAALGNTAAVNTAALGTSTLQRMGQEAMAANTYAGLQPGFAAQQGQQQMGMFQSGLNEALQSDMGDIRAKMPELVYQVYNNLMDNNNTQRTLKANRGATLAGAYGDQMDRDLSAWNTSQSQANENTTSETAGLTAGQVVAGAADAAYEKWAANTRVFGPTGDVTKWADNNPGAVMKQIEASIRRNAGGPVPAALVRQAALSVMNDLGLRTSLPKKTKAAAGAGAPSGPMGPQSPINFGLPGWAVPGVVGAMIPGAGPIGAAASLFDRLRG